MPRQFAIALILLSALAFGTMPLLAKIAYAGGTTPSMMLAVRFALAVVVLGAIVRWRRVPLPRGKTLAGFVLMGVLYTAQAQSYFTALMYASSGLAALLLYIYPALVMLIAVALGWERLKLRTGVLLALAVAGMVIMLGENLEGQPLGVLLGLTAAAVYALYILVGGRIATDSDPFAGTLVVMSVAAIGNGGIAFMNGSALPDTSAAWLAIAAIAALTVVAGTCFLIGIKIIGASQASIISTAEPVITLYLGVSVLGEVIAPGQLAGGAMVLAAVVMLALRPRARLIQA